MSEEKKDRPADLKEGTASIWEREVNKKDGGTAKVFAIYDPEMDISPITIFGEIGKQEPLQLTKDDAMDMHQAYKGIKNGTSGKDVTIQVEGDAEKRGYAVSLAVSGVRSNPNVGDNGKQYQNNTYNIGFVYTQKLDNGQTVYKVKGKDKNTVSVFENQGQKNNPVKINATGALALVNGEPVRVGSNELRLDNIQSVQKGEKTYRTAYTTCQKVDQQQDQEQEARQEQEPQQQRQQPAAQKEPERQDQEEEEQDIASVSF